MEILEVIKDVANHVGVVPWVTQVFVVVFATLVLNYIVRRVLRKLAARLEATANPWDDAVVTAARRPLGVLVWVLGLTLAIDIIQREAAAAIFEAVDPIREVAVIGIIAWFLVRLIKQVEANLLAIKLRTGEPFDRTTMDAIAKLLRVSVLITAALVMLQTLGFSVSGVLAFGGIGGIAVGFAAKDLLANFFGGLMIYLDRPFAVGDWIRSPDREIEGTVEEIGWRLTRIRTFDKRPLYVPNSTFTTVVVENPSRMHNRRIYEVIGVRYDDAGKLESIVQDVNALITSHPDIASEKTVIVNFDKFAPSSLDFFVYCFTKTTRWVEYHAIKQRVLLQILDIIESHGAEVAFPTSTVHLQTSPEAAGLVEAER